MKLVKEHINEKFTEEGDPIRDMSIGMITVKLYPHLDAYNKEFETTIIAKEFESFLKNNNIDYKIIRNSFGDYWPIVDFTGTKRDLIKMIKETEPFEYCKRRIKLGFATIESIFKINPVNEKFTEEGDPIHDLGIGNEFVRIKIGDVIEKKEGKTFYTSSKKKNSCRRIFFKRPIEPYFLTIAHTSYFGTIVDVKHNPENNKLMLVLVPFSNILNPRNLKNRILNGSYVYKKEEMDYAFNSGIGTYEDWSEYFKIVKE